MNHNQDHTTAFTEVANGGRAFAFLTPGPLSDGELELLLSRTVPPDPQKDTVPTYLFAMRVGGLVAGGIRFRAGSNTDVDCYAGNLGFNVDPPFRGRRLAERACRLLMPFAKAHGFQTLWITCDPPNHASRRTCERLGAVLAEIVQLPQDSDMYQDGEREKCRYRLDLA